MRVGLVVPYFEMGGVEVFLLRLARGLRARGHAVTLFATDARGAWWPELAQAGIDAEYLPAHRAWSNALHARSLAKRWSTQDVLLLNHSRMAQAALPWLPSDVAAVPVFHNDVDHVYDVGCANQQYWDLGVAVSPEVHARAAKRVGAERLVYINYGVEIPPSDQLAQRVPHRSSLKLLFVGRIAHEQKGVFLLPAILASLLRRGLDATLTIVGAGPDEPELAGMLARLGLEQKVTFKGPVANEAVYQELLQHHVLVAPSFYEGFGIGLVEAQACGCVPIVSRLPGITDVAVEDGRTGLLADRGDVEGFAECIARLGASAGAWGSLSSAGVTRARAFSVDRMVDAYVRAFAEARARALQGARSLRRSVCARRNEALTWRDRVPNFVRRLRAGLRGGARGAKT